MLDKHLKFANANEKTDCENRQQTALTARIMKYIAVNIVIFGFLILSGCSITMPKLGIDNGQLSSCPNSPNCVNSQSNDEKQGIPAILFPGNSEQAKTQILKLLGEMKRTKVVVSEEDYIHAECTSAIFRFVDDMEFYFPESDENGTTIEVRSASRTGHSDFGVNRKRVEAFRSLLK